MIESIDSITLNFDASSLLALNIILGLIMFGVALSLRIEDFKALLKRPQGPLIGMGAQFILLPAATWLLTRILQTSPSISLGMILVSACPGGNMSNFITHLARANTALSVSMTAISTVLAIVMTPFNLSFWGSISPDTRALLADLSLDPMALFGNILILLGLPLLFGMTVRARWPAIADRLTAPFKIGSVFLFVLLLVVAFHNNLEIFVAVIAVVALPVALHNGLAWLVGYGAATAARLPIDDRRAIAVEVAIQNSGLGLVLIFGFFNGLGGMAVIAAWWGIWHIIAGLFMATVWSRIRPTTPLTAASAQ